MRVQNKEMFKSILLALGMVVCLYLTGCEASLVNYYNRGTAYGKKGEYDLAILDYTKALELNPWFVQAYYNRAGAYGRKGQYELAILDYTKAIEMNPEFSEAYNNRGAA